VDKTSKARNAAKKPVQQQQQANGKPERIPKAAAPKKKPAKVEKPEAQAQDIPDVSKLTLSESENSERPKQKRKGRREREKERKSRENSSSDISQLSAQPPVKSNAADNSMQPPQTQAGAPLMSHSVGMYGYPPQGRPPSPLMPPQGMPPPMPPMAHPQMMFMRPGFTQPMPPYGRPHSPVGHMQPPMNAIPIRAPSPPVPPFPPPSHQPMTWQQQQHDQSKSHPSQHGQVNNQLPPNSAPETPVKQDEVPRDNQGQKPKAKRKGRRERERERMAKRAVEEAALNSSAQN
jgi:hypothetical protein